MPPLRGRKSGASLPEPRPLTILTASPRTKSGYSRPNNAKVRGRRSGSGLVAPPRIAFARSVSGAAGLDRVLCSSTACPRGNERQLHRREAFAVAQDAQKHDELCLFGWALVELIEAAARSNQPAVAAVALRQLSERTRISGTDWALGIEARSQALLSDDDAAEDLYRKAIGRLSRTRIKGQLGRAQLVYGE